MWSVHDSHTDINQSTGSLFVAPGYKNKEGFNVNRIKMSLPAFIINLYEGSWFSGAEKNTADDSQKW